MKTFVTEEERKARRENEIVIFEKRRDYYNVENAKKTLTCELKRMLYANGLSDERVEECNNHTGHYDSMYIVAGGHIRNSTIQLSQRVQVSIRHDRFSKPYVLVKSTFSHIGIRMSGKFYFRNDTGVSQVYRRNKDGVWILSQKDGTKSFTSKNLSFTMRTNVRSNNDNTVGDIFSFGHQAALLHDEYTEILKKLANHGIDVTVESLWEKYPLLKDQGVYLGHCKFDPKLINAYANTTDVSEVTRRLFGKRAVRKDLVREVAQSKIFDLAYVYALRDRKVPIDWYVQCLKQFRERRENIESHRDRGMNHTARSLEEQMLGPHHRTMHLREWTKDIDLTSRRRLLVTMWRKNDIRDQVRSIRDVQPYKMPANGRMDARAYKGLTHAPITRVDDLNDLENQINTRVNAARRVADGRFKEMRDRERAIEEAWYENTELGRHILARKNEAERRRIEEQRIAREKAIEEEKRKHGERIKNYETVSKLIAVCNESSATHELVLAKDRDTLNEWSDTLDNCISSYANTLDTHQTMLLGLYGSGKSGEKTLIAALELDIDNMQLRQFLGKHNSTLPIMVRQPILNWMNECGIDTSNYWGD